jgi:Fe-S-cluster containining protein
MSAPAADERAQKLFNELLSDPGVASGERRFPRRISRDEAADLAEALAVQVDHGCTARAENAARQSLPIVCGRGCNGCCEEMIMISQPEAIAVARWLMQAENQASRDAFLAAYPAWKAAAGDGPTRLADALTKRDDAGYLKLHVAQWQKRVLCAFNRDGECSVYPVRPLTCRNAHALETASRCSGENDGSHPASRLEFAPLDTYLATAQKGLRAAHNALGETKNRPAALCDAVYQQLQSLIAAARKRERRS